MISANHAFPPKLRLKKPAEFKAVFANPVKSSDRYFTLLAIRNAHGHPRVGLAIAKKVIKQAVNRNSIKRTVRESFRLQRENIADLDIVVLAKKDVLSAEPTLLRESLRKHWQRLSTRCG